MLDMAIKGRSGATKLTLEAVQLAASLYRAGVPRREICLKTGINVHTLKCIISGRNWGHVTGLPKTAAQK